LRFDGQSAELCERRLFSWYFSRAPCFANAQISASYAYQAANYYFPNPDILNVFPTSVPLMIEYEAVLMRSEHLAAARLTSSEANLVLDALAAVCEPIALGFLWRPRLMDPGDEMVLETAVNGRVRHLVSFNVRDLGPVARQFGIRVETPPAAWKEVLAYEEK
jgi:hypothetical protein